MPQPSQLEIAVADYNACMQTLRTFTSGEWFDYTSAVQLPWSDIKLALENAAQSARKCELAVIQIEQEKGNP